MAVAVILCFVSALFAVGTVADDIAFLSPIVGSNPGVTVAGVQSGSAPWLVNHRFAVLNDEGRSCDEPPGSWAGPDSGFKQALRQTGALMID